MTAPATGFSNIITETEIGGTAAFGGQVKRFLAGATLLLGDVVYINATENTAEKSVTNADYAKFLGVVVGGRTFSPDGAICADSTLVGQTAAASGEFVMVQIDGIAYIKSDGAILAGSTVIPDASVAGECDVAGANPGYTLGISLKAAADGSVGKILIRHSYNEA